MLDFGDILVLAGLGLEQIVLFIWMANRLQALYNRRLQKKIGETDIELADLRDLYERMLVSHKKLRSSAGMAALRDRKKAEKTAVETPEDFKKRIRKELHLRTFDIPNAGG